MAKRSRKREWFSANGLTSDPGKGSIRKRKVRRRTSPGLEALEDRTLLSSFLVTNLNDSGTGSLRNAIAGANAAGGNNLITFASNLNGGVVDLKSFDTSASGEILGLAAFSVFDNITIQGPSASAAAITIQRDPGAAAFRIFSVDVGASLTLNDLTLNGGVAQGGAGAFGGGGGAAGLGGAIAVNQASLQLNTVAMTKNEAVGGHGGVGNLIVNGSVVPGGGGGGLAFDGSFGNPALGGGGGMGGGPNGGFGSGNNGAGTSGNGNTAGPGGGGGGSGFASANSGNGGPGGFGGGGGGSGPSLAAVSGNGGSGGFGGGGGGAGLGLFGGGNGGAGGDFAGPGGGATASVVAYGSWRRRWRAGLGGAIFAFDGSLQISNSTIEGNEAVGVLAGQGAEARAERRARASAAASISKRPNTVSIVSTVISGNQADLGGGIYNSSPLTLANSTISQNTAATDEGGGLANFSSANLSNDTFSRNQTNQNGGGIINHGTLVLSGSTLVGNTANAFGGGLASDGALSVTNSTFYLNTANIGGGLDNRGSLVLADSTVANNSSTNGGGLDNAGPAPILTNTILAGNTGTRSAPSDILGTIDTKDSFNNLVDNVATDGGLSGNGNVLGINPGLLGFGSYGGPTQTLALSSTSKAIQAGNPSFAQSIDQRGVTRTGKTDIGAFEEGPYAIAFDSLSSPTIQVGTATTVLSGHISDPVSGLPVIGTVTITVNGVSEIATINPSTGTFSVNFPTSKLAVSPSGYPITYVYNGPKPPGGDPTGTGTLKVFGNIAQFVLTGLLRVSLHQVGRRKPSRSRPRIPWATSCLITLGRSISRAPTPRRVCRPTIHSRVRMPARTPSR